MRKVQRNGYRAALRVSFTGLLSSIILCYVSYMVNYEIGMLMGLGFVIIDSILIGVTGTKARAYDRVYKAEIEFEDFVRKMEEDIEEKENEPFKELDNETK